MKRLLKEKPKGITLIALIITIIVLLILAGVSVATLTGENGILTQSQSTKEKNAKSQVEEEVKLALVVLQIEESQKEMTQEEKRKFLEDELMKQQADAIVSINETRFLANYRGYEVEIDDKYNVSVKESFNPEVWDETATPEDAFIWQSDDPNSEEYGVVIGYKAKIENYTTLRFPSRCTEIQLLSLYDEEGVYQGTTRGFTNNILKVEIPGTVHTLGTWAFGDPNALSFQALEEIVMEEGVTIIDRAFEHCSNLKYITIPDTVNYIEDCAFLNTAWYNNQPDGVVYAGKVAYKYKGTMPSNTEIVLKEDTVSISSRAFSGCTGLVTINIPESVINIGSEAFSGCTGLVTINIPESVTNIGLHTFSGCTGLTSIIIPESVTNIGTYAFYGCTGLINISFSDSIISIENSAFYNTAWYNNQPDGLIYIGKVIYKYKGTMPSGTSITLNEDTVGIAGEAFSGCTGLTSIIIPESVTNIGASAFSGCTGLTNIIIPRTVTMIGNYAFKSWTDTQTINCVVEEQPEGWDYYWDYYNSPYYGYSGYKPAASRKANLVWGYTGD